MTLLTPLGLLGLLSLVAWLIIYLIRPNYQQKLITSSYIWKLSLKYKKKRLPISKLRNLLLILCQILILTLSAGILAQPNQVIKAETYNKEVVVIIDASASMWTTDDVGTTRFEKAIEKAQAQVDSTFSEDGVVTVMLCQNQNEVLFHRVDQSKSSEIYDALQNLLQDAESGNMNCSYGNANIEAAMANCEEILAYNPLTQVYIFTDTQYTALPKLVSVVNVAQSDKGWDASWNAAILNAYTEMEDNYYTFVVDVACYGRDETIKLSVNVQSPNVGKDGVPDSFTYELEVDCLNDATKRVFFMNADMQQELENDSDLYAYYPIPAGEEVFSYEYVSISIEFEDGVDSLTVDNNYYIYNGTKPTLKILYATPEPTVFTTAILGNFRNQYSEIWSIEVDEYIVKKSNEVPDYGYDFYIYESYYYKTPGDMPSAMPSSMPNDGVVLIVNPDMAPMGAGFGVSGAFAYNGGRSTLLDHEGHVILQGVSADNMEVTQYMKISQDGSYKELWVSSNEDPVLLLKEDDMEKVAVLGISPRFSNLTMEGNSTFPILMKNIFDYFLPPTLSENVYEVDENVTINARGMSVEIRKGSDVISGDEPLTTFPYVMNVALPGTYELTQELMSGDIIKEKFFVKIPALESNIRTVEETLPDLDRPEEEKDTYIDWLVYLAGAMVILLLAEWWLQGRDNM